MRNLVRVVASLLLSVLLIGCSMGPLCARVTNASASAFTLALAEPCKGIANEENCASCIEPARSIESVEFVRPADGRMMWRLTSADAAREAKVGKIRYGVVPQGFESEPPIYLTPGEEITIMINVPGRAATVVRTRVTD